MDGRLGNHSPARQLPSDENTARWITVAVMPVQAVIAILSVRLVAMINSAAVGLELVIVLVLGVALVIAAAVSGRGSVANLTSQGVAENAPNYFGVGGGLIGPMRQRWEAPRWWTRMLPRPRSPTTPVRAHRAGSRSSRTPSNWRVAHRSYANRKRISSACICGGPRCAVQLAIDAAEDRVRHLV